MLKLSYKLANKLPIPTFYLHFTDYNEAWKKNGPSVTELLKEKQYTLSV